MLSPFMLSLCRLYTRGALAACHILNVSDVLGDIPLQVDMMLGEGYRLNYLVPGCLLVGAGVLLCTTT